MTTKKLIIITAIAFSVAAPAHSAEREGRKKAAEGRPGLQSLRGNLEELNLTAEQKGKLEAFQQEQRGKMQGLRDASPDERREKFQKLQTETTAKMKEVLTPEQFTKWEKSRAPGATGAGAGDLASGYERIQKAMEELGLNEEQKRKVREAMQGQGQTLQGLRDATPEERREKFRKSQDQLNPKMKEILTPEQFAKWEKMRGDLQGNAAGKVGELKKRRAQQQP